MGFAEHGQASTRQAVTWLCRVLAGALVCGAAGCGVSAATPNPGSSDQAASGWVKDERVLRSIGGVSRVARWHLPGDTEVQMVLVDRYVSGMGLIPGVSLVYHREQSRWMLSLDGRLLPLDALRSAEPLPALPAGHQRPVVWQGGFEHLESTWHLAIFRITEPLDVPGVATEAEHALDVLLWRFQKE
jgi:hypothetical protein